MTKERWQFSVLESSIQNGMKYSKKQSKPGNWLNFCKDSPATIRNKYHSTRLRTTVK